MCASTTLTDFFCQSKTVSIGNFFCFNRTEVYIAKNFNLESASGNALGQVA
jgi:hypothetical protein